MKKEDSLALSQNSRKVLYFETVIYSILHTSYLCHRILKRHVLKGPDLMTLTIFTASRTFLCKIGFFIFNCKFVTEEYNDY